MTVQNKLTDLSDFLSYFEKTEKVRTDLMLSSILQCICVLLQFYPCSAPKRQVMSQTAKGENKYNL